jgi:hypothetical protein
VCGPSDSEKQLASQESAFSRLLQGQYATNFADQAGVLQTMNNMYTPIFQAGPDQAGFGPQQLAALSTQAGEGVAANYAKAQTSLNNTLAARGGGNEYLPTGGEDTLRQTAANAAANQASQESLAITNANYAQGRANWQQAGGGLQQLQADYAPGQLAQETSGAQGQAFNQADKVQEEKNQKEMAIAGGITSLASGLMGGISGGLGNLDTAGTSTGGEQFGNFASGFAGAFGG